MQDLSQAAFVACVLRVEKLTEGFVARLLLLLADNTSFQGGSVFLSSAQDALASLIRSSSFAIYCWNPCVLRAPWDLSLVVGGLTYSAEPGGSRDAGEKAREGVLWSHLCGGSLSPDLWDPFHNVQIGPVWMWSFKTFPGGRGRGMCLLGAGIPSPAWAL